MSIGIGDVKIELIDLETGEPETLTLKPTYRAATSINKHFGGYAAAIESVSKVDLDAFAEIIKYGVGFTPNGAKGLGERVWRTGSMTLAAPIVEFLSILINGGKPMGDKQIEDDAQSGEA